MTKNVRLLITLLAGLLLTGCDLSGLDGDRYTESINETFQLNPDGVLEIESFNGSIEIQGWEKNEVQLTGRKTASSEEQLAAIQLETNATPERVSIRARRTSGRNGGVHMVIRAPYQARVERAKSSNARIRVEDMKGPVTAQTSNGAILFRKIEGAASARTSNGRIEMFDTDGPVQATTSNGAIKLDRVTGGVEATTSNGAIDVTVARLDAGVPLSLTTSNGHIQLEAKDWNDNPLTARSSNGSITVRLPADAKASVDARTSHGSVDVEGQIERERDSRTDFQGRLNGGGAPIDLKTSNARIALRVGI